MRVALAIARHAPAGTARGCLACVEQITKAGGGNWGSYTNCPAIAADYVHDEAQRCYERLNSGIYDLYGHRANDIRAIGSNWKLFDKGRSNILYGILVKRHCIPGTTHVLACYGEIKGLVPRAKIHRS